MSESEKLNFNENEVISPIKLIDAKAEKERKKREKEAAAAAAGSGESKDANSQSSKKGKKSLGDTIAAAVASEVPLSRSQDGTPKDITSPTDAAPTTAAANGPPGEEKDKAKPKKEKAPKQKKPPPPPAVEKPFSPSLIDLRVGHILKCELHPNADSLFVSTMNVGDAPGTENTSEYEGQTVRTVCSGLNGLIPLEEMQGRKVVAVCNLKPVTMRGVKSCAMVLAASPRLKEGEVDDHKGPVELVEVPQSSTAGDRVGFEGWDEGEPDGQLNPKKKVWESIQPGFTTTDAKEVAFDPTQVEKLVQDGRAGTGLGRLKVLGKGDCVVKTLSGATVR